MKKLFLTGALALFGLMSAQKTDSGIRLGVNAGIPVGDFGKLTTFTAGVDLAYLYPLAENFRLGVATGYSHYFGKKTTYDLWIFGQKVDKVPDVGIIPVAATAEYTFGGSNVFLGVDLGYAFFTKKDFKNENEPLIVIGLLKGSIVFMADLIREIKLPLEIDFIEASSYGEGTQSSREVKILKDLRSTISGKNVLVVEDIIDSGFTLKKVLQILGSRNPKKISLCTLLDKPERREVEVDVQYIGFEIPNEFVVGYGLDYNENYRNLEYIGIANPEVFE